MSPVVRGQRQADSVYFNLSDAFDLAPHNMHKLSSFGFSDAYVRWFRSYLTNRKFEFAFLVLCPYRFK
jgi:hypothetical protein